MVAAVASTVIAAACTSGGGKSGASSPTTAAPSTSSSAPPVASTTQPATTAPVSLPAIQPIAWKPCSGLDGPQGYDCGTVQVPLDYTKPGGQQIGIAVDRKPATGAKIGSLITNPGGPGASGVDELDYLVSLLSPAVLARFDVIGFDPRGVGRSAPVRCETGQQLDQFLHLNPAPATDAGFQTLLAGAKSFDQHCQAMSGSLLPFVGTVNVARDMEEIRSAVGDSKLNFFGFSYGTFLGATYAEMFPTHVRAMVLDGALDPALDPIASNIEQAVGFDSQLNAFFDYCTSTPTCSWKPKGTPKADFDALMARIAAQPLPGSGARTLGPGEAFFGVVQPLYDRSGWDGLASALQRADAGDGSALLAWSDEYTQRNANGVYSNSLEANNAVTCVDQPWPRDAAALEQAAVRAKQRAPEFGVADLYGALTCVNWPAGATSQPHRIVAAGSPPIVVVGSTGDPATPYSDAQSLASELQHGVLLTRVGDGHTGYRSSACIRTNVDSYLVSLTVPPAGTRCPTP